jgi:predicted Rossmann fold flavoprotein
MRVAIIGAGASGLTASLLLAKSKISVDIFEQNSKIAKKILASGNGKCNISNKNISPNSYHSKNISFIKDVLNRFSYKDFEKFAKDNLSLFLKSKDDGRVYPLSNESKTVVDSFESQLNYYGVNIFFNKKVDSIKKIKDSFIIDSKEYDFVILSTGSLSASHLGGSDSGYSLAKNFNHNIVDIYPSLVQLKTNFKNQESLAGVKLEAKVESYIDNIKVKTVVSDLLFTKYGLSGYSILDSSQKISYALLNYQNVRLSIDLIPSISKEVLEFMIVNSLKKGEFSIERVISSIIPKKLSIYFLELSKIDKSLKKVSTKSIKTLIFNLKSFSIDIDDTNGFKNSEVSGGGVDLDNIDSSTMESKLVQNLYITGELLDVLGDRGGYNLHFAWASGYLAYKSILSKAKA